MLFSWILGVGAAVAAAGLMRPSRCGAEETRANELCCLALPPASRQGSLSLEQVLTRRRSLREYRQTPPLTTAELGQLLWAGQGRTNDEGARTTPSAGALYPLELYALAGSVQELQSGLYRYRSAEHALEPVWEGDRRMELAQAAMNQPSLRSAAAVLVIAAVYSRTAMVYCQRGRRYVDLEAGHAAQNIGLQAVAIELGTAAVGAFNDADVKKVLRLSAAEQPLYLIPVGRCA